MKKVKWKLEVLGLRSPKPDLMLAHVASFQASVTKSTLENDSPIEDIQSCVANCGSLEVGSGMTIA